MVEITGIPATVQVDAPFTAFIKGGPANGSAVIRDLTTGYVTTASLDSAGALARSIYVSSPLGPHRLTVTIGEKTYTYDIDVVEKSATNRSSGNNLNNFVEQATEAFFTSEYLRDYTHASKTFRANSYSYAPKYKFLFHVYFDVNKDYIGATNQWPTDQNFGLAVKTVQLPKYSFELQTMNQYNRKRIIQTKINYDPINITFHDDNANLIRRLWYTYYTYYYKDASQVDTNMGVNVTTSSSSSTANSTKQDLNRRNIYDASISGSDDWGYIGETSNSQATNAAAGLGISKAPFFKAINVYGFNQHNFVLYRLINPMIESFSHDTYDYSQANGIMENQMTVQYETVKYYEGAIDGRTPDQIVKGFGTEAHYDKTLSPISRPGSQATILGPGGLLSAAGGVLSDLQSGNIVGAIQKAGAAANTFKNPQAILKTAKAEALGAVNEALKGTPNRNTLFDFPTNASTIIRNLPNTINGAYKGVIKQPPNVG